jgi:hypothetical protein
MKVIKLKNGSEEVEPIVLVTMASLHKLFQDQPIAAYELVMKCRDRTHKFWGNYQDVLEKWALVQSDGNVHDSIQNIVLSAVTGDGLYMTLSSPAINL